MKATLLSVALMISAGPAYAQIFKCTNPDGSVSFASVPCVSPVGESEYVQPQVNQVGSLVTETDALTIGIPCLMAMSAPILTQDDLTG